MKITLYKLSEKIKEAIGISPTYNELCEDIVEIKKRWEYYVGLR